MSQDQDEVLTAPREGCPYCGSLAATVGVSAQTLRYSPPFTDDEGRVHYHDSNRRTVQNVCRGCKRGYLETGIPRCWCGWPGEDPGLSSNVRSGGPGPDRVAVAAGTAPPLGATRR